MGGGVPGVGKTTLVGTVLSELRPDTAFLDPGVLFNTYVFEEQSHTAEHVEELVADTLIRKCHSARLVLATWHWAVWTPTGYKPQIPLPRWRLMLSEARLERLYLVDVTAQPKQILSRRIGDYEKHPRKRHLNAICEEILASERYYRLFASAAEEYTHVFRCDVNNTGIDSGLARMRTLYEEAYETARTPT